MLSTYWALEETISVSRVSTWAGPTGQWMNRQDGRTLDISHALRQDLLQDLGVLQLLLDLGDDGIGQLLLLALLDLALITDPGVQDGLGLGSQGGLLLQLIGLSLELGGFLWGRGQKLYGAARRGAVWTRGGLPGRDLGQYCIPWRPRTGSW